MKLSEVHRGQVKRWIRATKVPIRALARDAEIHRPFLMKWLRDGGNISCDTLDSLYQALRRRARKDSVTLDLDFSVAQTEKLAV